MAEERLQKVLARAGIASRRAAEELITKGRVKVDGRVVSELGVKVDPRRAKIELDGNRLMAEPLVYIVLHKPRGVMCTLSDPEGRPTIAELLQPVGVRVVPVGRLDFHTSGALLCTNDGDFANALAHPRSKVKKVYVAKVQGLIQDEQLPAWQQSIEIDGRATAPAEVRRLRFEGDKTWLELTLREGRNRQVRRLGEATGALVMRLARISHAGVTAEDLRPGQWRHLTLDELVNLKRELGVPKRVRSPGTEAWEIQVKSNAKVPRGALANRAAHEGRRPRAAATERSEERPRKPSGGRFTERPESRGPRKPPVGDRFSDRTDTRGPRKPADRFGERADTRGPRKPAVGDRFSDRADTRGPRKPADRFGERADTRGPRKPAVGDRFNDRTDARGPRKPASGDRFSDRADARSPRKPTGGKGFNERADTRGPRKPAGSDRFTERAAPRGSQNPKGARFGERSGHSPKERAPQGRATSAARPTRANARDERPSTERRPAREARPRSEPREERVSSRGARGSSRRRGT